MVAILADTQNQQTRKKIADRRYARNQDGKRKLMLWARYAQFCGCFGNVLISVVDGAGCPSPAGWGPWAAEPGQRLAGRRASLAWRYATPRIGPFNEEP